MPVEIRELVIKTTIVEDNSAVKSSGSKDNKEEFISECVEEVIRILNEEKER